MLFDKKTKLFKIIAVGAVLIIGVLILAISGYYYKSKVQPQKPESTIIDTQPVFSPDVLNYIIIVGLIITFIAVIFVVTRNAQIQRFSSSLEEITEYIRSFHFSQNGACLDTTVGENMEVRTIGDYMIMSFKSEGVTYEINVIGRIIKAVHGKSFNTSVRHAEQSDIFRSMIKGNQYRSSVVSDLMRKGYDEKDITKTIENLENNVNNQNNGELVVR